MMHVCVLQVLSFLDAPPPRLMNDDCSACVNSMPWPQRACLASYLLALQHLPSDVPWLMVESMALPHLSASWWGEATSSLVSISTFVECQGLQCCPSPCQHMTVLVQDHFYSDIHTYMWQVRPHNSCGDACLCAASVEFS